MTRYREALVRRGIWELWHDVQWDDYEGEDNLEKVVSHMRNRLDRGLILYGTNGTGKTMLLNLAMKDLLLSKQGTVHVIDFRHLVSAYTDSWNKEGGEKMQEILNCNFLGIDDIGKEFKGGDISRELAITTLDYVIRYRFQRKRPTWITMNLQLKDVKTYYNEHISSLLKRCCDAVHIDGTDYGDKLFNKS
jgi:DNA replication protein DnaC